MHCACTGHHCPRRPPPCRAPSQVGLSNYASAYCVGLLVARRVLTKLGLADTYKGQEEPDGEDYNVEAVEDGPRPFYCLLDTGLKRTSTGSKVGRRAGSVQGQARTAAAACMR